MATRKPNPAGAAAPGAPANGAWHLAESTEEERLAAIEFSLEHLAQAYYRWKASCLRAVSDSPLSGEDVAVLNTIRMGEEAKGLSEIARLVNRTDTPNLQYALRKLIKAGLVESAGGTSRKETRYQVTAQGLAATTAYARVRAEILVPLAAALDPQTADLGHLEARFGALAGLYDRAAQRALLRRHRPQAAAPLTPNAARR